jgi:glyoxylase-like metal-dependent hydrolase (beta-lactamase superfamily II)
MSNARRITRREALLAGACFCSVRAFAQKATDEARAFVTEEVAAGIHIRRGADEDVTPQNEDAIANIGFIVGRDAVAVIDPGGSLIDGQRLRATIRQTTQLPIKYVVMSHVHPDHFWSARVSDRQAGVCRSRTSATNASLACGFLHEAPRGHAR